MALLGGVMRGEPRSCGRRGDVINLGPKGLISQVQRWSIHDGPGIRTTVFLKGCPLRCVWCHNPELQSFGTELLFDSTRCVACGRCVAVCPSGAAQWAGDAIELIRSRCQACGACARACPNEAREVVGKYLSPGEVLGELVRDRVFYERSGGGIAVSGGEPLAQPVFTAELLRGAKEAGLHTALDTCGYAAHAVLRDIARHVDLVLYDLKQMDSRLHTVQTGVSNDVILENLAWLLHEGPSVWIRIPVVHGFTDDDMNFEAAAAFLAREGRPALIELLPYHEFGVPKYHRLGREYRLDKSAVPGDEVLRRASAILRRTGAPVKVGSRVS